MHLPNKKLRPNTDWHTREIDEAIAARRKAENVWRNTKLTVHHQIYRHECTVVINKIRKAKRDFYTSKVSEAGSDQKALFSVSQTMMNKNRDMSLPTHSNKEDLANKFAEFFTDKVVKNRSDLDKQAPSICHENGHIVLDPNDIILDSFQPASG